ncbi:MAG: DEAD/DEAH box helicase [Candidatus Absconditabacterales bacterium]
MKFDELGLIAPILKAVSEQGYTVPTPIQAQSIPVVLSGKDVFGCAQTGTGKTASFAIPTLQILYNQKANRQPIHNGIQTLILTPTRELAIQIGESFAAYGKYTGLKHTVIFGGVSQVPQVKTLRAGVDILVATPGRLLDLMNQKHVSLASLKILILDEADRMLDMGFIHDVKKILSKVPNKRQTLFFSATMPSAILDLAKNILHDPVKITVTPVSSTVEIIQQQLYMVGKTDKKNLLIHLLKDPTIESAIVFTKTKHGANKVSDVLEAANIKAAAIHGNKSQNARQLALANLKSKKIRVLVATDIAARGIDIDQLSHVFIFDIPTEPETYVHRIGRTGRAGASGVAIVFCDHDEKKYLNDITKLIKQEIPLINDHPYPLIHTNSSHSQTAERGPKSHEPRRSFGRPQADRPSRDSRPQREGGSASRPSQGRVPDTRAPRAAHPSESRAPRSQDTRSPSRPSHGGRSSGSSDRPSRDGSAARKPFRR